MVMARSTVETERPRRRANAVTRGLPTDKEPDMDESTSERTDASGRSIKMRVWGSTPEEIELAALDEARQFFGGDLILRVVRNYEVHGILPSLDTEAAAAGKRYTATVTVRVVEGAPGE